MNDFSIFSKDYMKNIYLLGASFCEGCIMGSVYAINRVFYLETHKDKYELRFEGIIDKSEKTNNLEVYCKKVSNYELLPNGICFTCDGEVEGRIKLNIFSDKAYLIKDKEFKKEESTLLNNILENSHSLTDDVIVTNAFAFILNEETNGKQLGNNIINKKAFTRCNVNELMEILNIPKTIEKSKNDVIR